MKRVIGVIVLISTIWITACSASSASENETNIVGNPTAPYSKEEALKNDDIVAGSFATIYNADRFFSFLDNVKKGIPDGIRITSFTYEGDPIFRNLVFNERIAYTYDYTQDPHSKPGPDQIQSTNCEGIEKVGNR